MEALHRQARRGRHGGSTRSLVDSMLPHEHCDPQSRLRAQSQEGLASGGIFAYRPGLEVQSTEAGFVAAVSVVFGLAVVWAGYLLPGGGGEGGAGAGAGAGAGSRSPTYVWGYMYLLVHRVYKLCAWWV